MFLHRRYVLIAALGVLSALSAAPASATQITFSTTGAFNGSGSTITFGSGANTLTLTFNGIPSSTVDANPFTFASLGFIHTSSTGTGATITPGTTLTINIDQTVPGIGNGNLGGTISGVISTTNSTGLISFTVNSVVIAGITYSIQNNPLALVPPNTNNGDTSIQARLDNPVPEPLTSLLVGAGLIGLASFQRYRRNR